jgi:hypothetical protein
MIPPCAALTFGLLVAQAAPDRAAPPPASTPAPAPRAERVAPDDEEVVRNLELLEKLDLLQRLELFDAAGDEPHPAGAKGGSRPPEAPRTAP